MKKIKFDIFGMTCTACVSHVEKAVNKLSGLKNVNVNLLSNNMTLEYDEKCLNVNDIIKAVEDAGYGINISNNDNKNNFKNKKEIPDEIKSMKNRLIISVFFLIPLMYISMHQMLEKFFGIHIPVFIKKFFDGTENSLNFAFVQFILLLPILYVNRNYFITGFKRLFKMAPNMDSLIALGSSASVIYGVFAIYMICYGLRTK